EAYAKQCAVEGWSHYKSASIPLEEFMDNWLYGMNDDDMLFWSDEAYAKQCAVEGWSHYKSASIPLEEFMDNWL
ncbi:DUF2750 domain-containing protein, partial [Priestia megaterium]